MIARRAAEQAGTDVAEAQHGNSLAGTVSRPAHRRRPAAQPAASRMLAPHPESVGDAREFTRATLRAWGLAAVSDDAELVVSELVTNALRHGLSGSGAPGRDGSGPVIGLRLMIKTPHLICMVTDPSREMPRRRDSDLLDATGRGLCVIESCSSGWDWCPLDAGGKAVWALLPGK